MEPRNRTAVAGVALIVVVAALARLPGIRSDLWLDEIWTLAFVDGVKSPLQILTELRHDNNHVLNTLLVYLLRPVDVDWVYRLPAWIASVAIVALGAWIAWWGDGGSPGTGSPAPDASPGTRAAVAATLLGGSYALIHYGSEARGYSLAAAFGLLAIGVALRGEVRLGDRSAIVFWIAVVLAVLSQALAMHFFLAVVAWSVLRIQRERAGWLRKATALLWWHLVPALACFAFYVGFLRDMTIGGGPRRGAFASLTGMVALAIGSTGGEPGEATWPYLAVALVVLLLGVWWLWRRSSDQWLLYAVGIAASPAALVALQPTNLYFERYFFASAVLWLLLAGRLLARLASRGSAGALVCVLVIAAFVASSAPRVARLARDGRGHYQDALRYVLEHSPSDVVAVTSDNDFRNGVVIEYHAARLGAGQRIRYVGRNSATPDPAWYFAHRRRDGFKPPATIRDGRGRRYRLVATFPTTPPSGWHWYLYRRIQRDVAGQPGR